MGLESSRALVSVNYIELQYKWVCVGCSLVIPFSWLPSFLFKQSFKLIKDI